MNQVFKSRTYILQDIEAWNEKGELILAPKFQRRKVWSEKARSYLIDTIVRGKPIAKIYMRQRVNPDTRRTTREIVDGQQRLRTILSYLKDGFPIMKTHNSDPRFSGKRFSQLDTEAQKDILGYEIVIGQIDELPDSEIYDIFARLNTYSIRLNSQELRNSQWFGEFKSSVYDLSNEFNTFWSENNIFTEKQILRMDEAEFVSELLIQMAEGIRAKTKSGIDNYYRDHDDKFPKRATYEKRFRSVMDDIGGIFGTELEESRFSEPRLFLPLFLSIYHARYGLPGMELERVKLRKSDFPKIRIALSEIEEIFENRSLMEEIRKKKEAGEDEADILLEFLPEDTDLDESGEISLDDLVPKLTDDELNFYDAYSVHWVHAKNRKLRTNYIYKTISSAIKL